MFNWQLQINVFCFVWYFLADGEEPIVSDTEDDGNVAKRAQIAAAEQAAAKIMPPPPTPPVPMPRGPTLASAVNKMQHLAPKVS